MEQDFTLYEYKMANETYRFECHSAEEAHKYREYALLHFKDKLGSAFNESNMSGPEKVITHEHIPASFVRSPE